MENDAFIGLQLDIGHSSKIFLTPKLENHANGAAILFPQIAGTEVSVFFQ